jgi:hypothetical protein
MYMIYFDDSTSTNSLKRYLFMSPQIALVILFPCLFRSGNSLYNLLPCYLILLVVSSNSTLSSQITQYN